MLLSTSGVKILRTPSNMVGLLASLFKLEPFGMSKSAMNSANAVNVG